MTLQNLAATVGITTRKAEQFLFELANLQSSKKAHARIVRRFPEFFPEALREPGTAAESFREWLYKVNPLGGGSLLRGEYREEIDGRTLIFGRISTEENLERVRGVFLIYMSSVFLPGIWASRNIRQVQWKIFGLRLLSRGPTPRKTLLEALVEPPPINPFEVALIYLWENIHRTRRCQLSDCPTPYFFQKKKGQKYCSDKCSSDAQREIQARWWREHGKQWREERKK